MQLYETYQGSEEEQAELGWREQRHYGQVRVRERKRERVKRQPPGEWRCEISLGSGKSGQEAKVASNKASVMIKPERKSGDGGSQVKKQRRGASLLNLEATTKS